MSRHGLIAGILVFTVTACSAPDDPAGPSCGLPSSSQSACPAGAGTVELRFDVSDGVRNSGFLVDPLKGTVHGDILRPEHVGPTGPTSEAESIHAVRVDDVDLTASAGATGASVQAFTASLCAGTYEFLGFLDVDGNADDPAFSDKGDPVTTPGKAKAQQFEVKENSHTTQTIVLDMTLACTVTCLNPPICVL